MTTGQTEDGTECGPSAERGWQLSRLLGPDARPCQRVGDDAHPRSQAGLRGRALIQHFHPESCGSRPTNNRTSIAQGVLGVVEGQPENHLVPHMDPMSGTTDRPPLQGEIGDYAIANSGVLTKMNRETGRKPVLLAGDEPRGHSCMFHSARVYVRTAPTNIPRSGGTHAQAGRWHRNNGRAASHALTFRSLEPHPARNTRKLY